MTFLAWPLERNQIRRETGNNAFGMVRNGGARPHQGWDLVAAPMTPCYAIADGRIDFAHFHGELGNLILLEFEHHGRTLYAAYAHLSFFAASQEQRVKRGERIGYTGTTGNAKSMRGDDLHLHFEIRTMKFPGKGLGGRIDPASLYGGRAPIGTTYFECKAGMACTSGTGLKAAGFNVRGGGQ